ncbi:MAG: HAD hydrolase family protein [Candidatus Levybacteria bacterium]|nr:HAD hydrolase family protein [Candidatus Levybacteria bacterium]
MPESRHKRLITQHLNQLETITIKHNQCGVLIASYLKQGRALLLDVDGVICKADSLDHPELTTPHIINNIKKLESTGRKVGIATARGSQITDYLRFEHGLRLDGPLIYEEGQVMVIDGEKIYLSNPNHTGFIKSVRAELKMHKAFSKSWQMAKEIYENRGVVTFCPGDTQWQGECRASFWFFSDEKTKHGRDIIISMFEPTLTKLSAMHKLDYKNDLSISVGRMSVGNLGILSIKGKKEGQPINKGTAARLLRERWIFVADGLGDISLAFETRQNNGLVIGIEGNLDDSDEPHKFLENADCVLSTPEDFAKALDYASFCLNY